MDWVNVGEERSCNPSCLVTNPVSRYQIWLQASRVGALQSSGSWILGPEWYVTELNLYPGSISRSSRDQLGTQSSESKTGAKAGLKKLYLLTRPQWGPYRSSADSCLDWNLLKIRFPITKDSCMTLTWRNGRKWRLGTILSLWSKNKRLLGNFFLRFFFYIFTFKFCCLSA